MKEPEQPSVPPSEPELEKRMVEKAMKDIQTGEFDGIQVYLPHAREYLNEHGLDIDTDGFIVNDEGEYATPYVFVDELVKEYVKDEDESIFDAFFRPVTHERVYGWDNKKIHLSDLHSIITTEDGSSHPVRDGSFDIAELHARLETGFKAMAGWSDIVKKENIDEKGRWLCIAKESEQNLELNCMNAKCSYTGLLSSWNGDENTSPECPECDGEWDSDGITVCTICESWYWGTYFNGDSIYAEPACANCGADMEYLERVNRYDEVDSYENLVREERPEFTVLGLDKRGKATYTFDHTDTWEEAVEEKEFAERVSSGSAFENVETVAIYERDQVGEITRFHRTDDQPS